MTYTAINGIQFNYFFLQPILGEIMHLAYINKNFFIANVIMWEFKRKKKIKEMQELE